MAADTSLQIPRPGALRVDSIACVNHEIGDLEGFRSDPRSSSPRCAATPARLLSTGTHNPMNAEAKPKSWSLAARLGFRLLSLYWLLYLFPVGLVPGLRWVVDVLVGWVGSQVFHLKAERVVMTGSGDTTFDYVHVFCVLVLATAGAVIWSTLDRRTLGYPRLADLLRSILRFALAFWMLGYGVAKFPTESSQFPPPSVGRLMQPYGESSPMGLLWTFMGASAPYALFVGLVECLGGVLLLFRRTALLGALVSAGVMIHVVLLNFCYDVPVKLFSSHLLLMSLCVAWPDRRRLVEFFLTHRTIEPLPPRMPYGVVWLNPLHSVIKWTLAVGILSLATGRLLFREMDTTTGEAKPPDWYGTYLIESLEPQGAPTSGLLSDRMQWHRLAIARFPHGAAGHEPSESNWVDTLVLRNLAGVTTNWPVALHADLHELRAKGGEATAPVLVFKYRAEGAHLIELEILTSEGSSKAKLKPMHPTDFPLMRRGFHWINEYPFNR